MWSCLFEKLHVSCLPTWATMQYHDENFLDLDILDKTFSLASTHLATCATNKRQHLLHMH
jgi:hypothetical protein